MTNFQKISLFLLRVSLGGLFFYAGITKITVKLLNLNVDPAWSAQKYLEGAKAFSDFYIFLASPALLPFINFINAWGLTLLGVSLILGIFVRLSSVLGIILMSLYYLALGFPYPNAHSYIVDEHIIYIFALLTFISFRAGRAWGLDIWCKNLPFCKKFS